MNEILFQIAIILLLLVANGLFAMAEIAVVSAKKGRLRNMAERGNAGAQAALELAESPNRFLATVQVGITLVGIFAGAFGGATLAAQLAVPLAKVEFAAPYANQIAFVVVVVIITYFSLVLGELVPKRFGLSDPEGISAAVAKPMRWLSVIAAPLIKLLTVSTDALLRLLGFKPAQEAAVTGDEVKVLMQEGLRAGAFSRVESHIVHSALELDQLAVRDLMTPRPKIIWLNQEDSHDAIWHKIVVSGHSHFPVYKGNRDLVAGLVSIKAIYANLAAGAGVKLCDLMTSPLIVPASQSVVQLLETFKQTGKHIALVTDEFGSIVGLVTLHDVMEAVLGDFPSQDQRSRPQAKKRDDGSWLIDAMIELEQVEKALPGVKFDTDQSKDYRTLAGFVVKQLGHVPKEGETFESQGYVFEVLDMDRHRVDKVLVMSAKTGCGPAPQKS
jgi:putative hemolysin